MHSRRQRQRPAGTRCSPAVSGLPSSQRRASTPIRGSRCSTAGTNLPRMARSWGELLGEEDARPEPEDGGAGMFARLRDSLGRSRRALTEQVGAATFDAGDEASWGRLEEALIAADVGVPATAELVQRLEVRPDAGAGLTEALQEEIARMLGEPARLDLDARPSVILVVGVNGTGKTTTIGKLAAKLSEHGRSV